MLDTLSIISIVKACLYGNCERFGNRRTWQFVFHENPNSVLHHPKWSADDRALCDFWKKWLQWQQWKGMPLTDSQLFNCKDNISQEPFSQCESLQGIRVQVRNWINWYSYNNWIIDTKCRVKIPTMWQVIWNIWEICKRSWCQCMSHHALKIFRFS